jgi:diguanylate cyclase (GGDEF)-like protein
VLKERVRPGDLICRYGGEEFMILTPIPDVAEAMRSAEMLRKAVENATFASQGHTLRITISLGVAHYPQNGVTPEDLLSSVDKALYYSKAHGRNRVTNFRDIK